VLPARLESSAVSRRAIAFEHTMKPQTKAKGKSEDERLAILFAFLILHFALIHRQL
jgi:hypothetical protein